MFWMRLPYNSNYAYVKAEYIYDRYCRSQLPTNPSFMTSSHFPAISHCMPRRGVDAGKDTLGNWMRRFLSHGYQGPECRYMSILCLCIFSLAIVLSCWFILLVLWCCGAWSSTQFFDLCIFDRKFGQALVKVRNLDLLQRALNFNFKRINFLWILDPQVFSLGFTFFQLDGNVCI